MFKQASVRTNLRDAAVITQTTTLTLTSASGYAPSDALFVCFNVASRTQGTITVTFQGSLDGTTWFELPAALGVTLSADGISNVDFTGRSIPKYLRATLTYAGSFDGTLEVWSQTTATVS